MEVSPTGQPVPPTPGQPGADAVALLHALVQLQAQTLEVQRQVLQNQQQQLELAKEAAQIAREQRARQISELERWQAGHERVIDQCREGLGQLEQVHAALMTDLVNHVADNHENLVDGEFALTDFVDRFGPRLAHLNTMLAVLRPLAAAQRKPEA
jgi:chromosome segregation ATPase